MIICLGTTPAVQRVMTFDRLQVDGVNRATRVAQVGSGKSINVTRVAHTLEEPVIATGFIGGEGAAFIRKDLDTAGIRHDFVQVQPATRTCITVIDEHAGTATELIEESKRVETEAWTKLSEKLETLLPAASVLVLSGTLPPAAPPEFYARCVRQASHHGVRSIVDATGEPLRHALAAKPFIVKPNRGEMGTTLGIDSASDEGSRNAMRKLIAAGAEWAVVTMGGDGATVSDASSFWRVAAPKVRVISPIGSGDAFAAGLAVGLMRGQPVNEACILATACGAANAMTPTPGFLRAEDVEHLQRDMRLT